MGEAINKNLFSETILDIYTETLEFMWNSSPREKFNISSLVILYHKILILEESLGYSSSYF